LIREREEEERRKIERVNMIGFGGVL